LAGEDCWVFGGNLWQREIASPPDRPPASGFSDVFAKDGGYFSRNSSGGIPAAVDSKEVVASLCFVISYKNILKMLIKLFHLAEVSSARVFSPPENIRKTQKFPDVFFLRPASLFLFAEQESFLYSNL